jgi:hypothetical protein
MALIAALVSAYAVSNARFAWGRLHCLLQKRDAVQAGHALVGKQQGHAVVAHLQLLQEVERSFRRIASYHAVFRAVLRPQIALDRPQNIGVVIHTQQNWFRHALDPSQREDTRYEFLCVLRGLSLRPLRLKACVFFLCESKDFNRQVREENPQSTQRNSS